MKSRELIEWFTRPLPRVEPVMTCCFRPAYRRAAARLVIEGLINDEHWPDRLVVEVRTRKRRPSRRRQPVGPLTRREVLGLTQREVAVILGLSERAVRAIEKRALAKLRRHPQLRQLWAELGGQLDEAFVPLTTAEVEALFGLARSPQELNLMFKVVGLVQRSPASAPHAW